MGNHAGCKRFFTAGLREISSKLHPVLSFLCHKSELKRTLSASHCSMEANQRLDSGYLLGLNKDLSKRKSGVTGAVQSVLRGGSWEDLRPLVETSL
jgi:hypothetical protein